MCKDFANLKAVRPVWLALIVLLVSCSPAKAPPASVPAPTAPPVADPAPTGTVTPPAAAPTPTATPVTPPRPFDESLLHGREFLWENHTKPAGLVRHQTLGALNNDLDQIATVKGFLGSAAGGSFDPATTEPRWRAYLTAWVKAHGSELGEGTAVVGEAMADVNDSVSIPVLWKGTPDRWGGWVALKRTETGWAVSDVSLDRIEAPSGSFDPESPVQAMSTPSRR